MSINIIIASIIAHIASLDSHLFSTSKVGGILSSHWSWKLKYYTAWYHKVWVMKFYCLSDSFVFVKTCGELLINYELTDICVKGGFFQKVQFGFFKSPNKIFQKTILNLKFKVPAHNIRLLWAGILNFKFRIVFLNIFFWRLGYLKNKSHLLKKTHL